MSGRLGPTGAAWAAVIALYVAAGVVSPAMFQVGQVLNILQVAAFLGLIATGQTLAVLVAGIDLSQAGVVTLTNIVVTSIMLGSDQNVAVAVAVCIALSAGVGLVNGLLVTRLAITPLVATLAMNAILFGAALVYTGGAPRGSSAPLLNQLGQGNLLGVPSSTIVWLVVALPLAWATHATIWGRQLYATGANPTAAALMGVPVERVLVSAYVGSAVLACLGGLLLTAYVGSPSLGIGNQFLLTSVAAVVVGGTALTGGVGGILATIAGVLFITELTSFTNMLRISSGTQQILYGAIIALSVIGYRLVSGQPARA